MGELIRELDPTGVPFRPLAALGRRNSGTSITAAKMKTIRAEVGEVRVFAGGHTVADVDEQAIPARDIVREPSIIVKSRGHIGFTYYERPFTHKAELWSYTLTDPSIDQKFVYHYLLTKVGQLQEIARATSVKLPQLSVRDTDALRIPVPPLEVQREIARTLDQFVDLEAELQAHLEAELVTRSTQYRHLRDETISTLVKNGVTEVPIAALAGDGFFRDGDWVESKDQDPEGEVRLTQLADVGVGVFRDRSNRWMRVDQAIRLSCTFLQPGDILIARMPDPLGRACQVPPGIGKAVSVVDVAILRSKRVDVSPRYVMHAINSSHVREQILSFQAGGTRQRVSRGNLGTVTLPVPCLDIQASIADTFDKYDALVNDLSIDLRAELAARRKQYEYYRDKLLTFEEAPA